MQDEAAKELIAHVEKVEALVASGALPDSPYIWPRIAYCGHECIGLFEWYGDKAHYRCVTCKNDFKDNGGVCQACFTKDNCYRLNHNHSARWRCRTCKHEWEGEDGHKCPSCGAEAA
jgi:hypothetical protein